MQVVFRHRRYGVSREVASWETEASAACVTPATIIDAVHRAFLMNGGRLNTKESSTSSTKFCLLSLGYLPFWFSDCTHALMRLARLENRKSLDI